MEHLYYKNTKENILLHFARNIEKSLREKTPMYTDIPNILYCSTYYYTAGDVKKALEVIEYGLAIYTREESLLIEKCKILILLKNYLKASTTLDFLDNPESPKALFERIKLAMLTKHNKEAKAFVEKLLKKVSSKEDLYIQLTFFFAVNHMLNYAKECWQAANKHHTRSYDYDLAHIALLYEQEEYKQAHQICLKLFKTHPNNLVISLYSCYIYYKMHMYNKSLKVVRHLKKLHPKEIHMLKLESILNNILR